MCPCAGLCTRSCVCVVQLVLRPNCHFVFGGDTIDRGPGDLRVLSHLVALKNTYPDRVHFVLGNRDVNKMRLPSELHPANLAKAGRIYWDDTAAPPGQSAADRLRWILLKTMGSPQAFEWRRQELAEMGRPSSDQAVVISYLDSVAPDGLLTQYLRHGKIAVCIGDTIFVHGALHPISMAWVPPAKSHTSSPTAASIAPSLLQWARSMNAMAESEVSDFVAETPTVLAALDAELASQTPESLAQGTHGSSRWQRPVYYKALESDLHLSPTFSISHYHGFSIRLLYFWLIYGSSVPACFFQSRLVIGVPLAVTTIPSQGLG